MSSKVTCALVSAVFMLCSCGRVMEGPDDRQTTQANKGQPVCPDVCAAVCSGETVPEIPKGCPVPHCKCGEDPDPGCPDVCGLICKGEPEPKLPKGCPVPQCKCDQEPGCPGANPQGCKSTGCPNGYTCEDVFALTNECIPSSCGCDETNGGWICTEDCNGGKCVPDCSAPNPQGCKSTGCPDGYTCEDVFDLTNECIPSSCGCDETSGWICTSDCNGGKCMPL